MENNQNPRIIITDSYKVEHKEFVEKLIYNSCYEPRLTSDIIYYDAEIAKRITEESINNTNNLMVKLKIKICQIE